MMPRPCLPLLLLPRSAPLQLKAAPWSRRGPPRSSPAWSRMRGGPRRPPRAGRPCAGASKAEEVGKKWKRRVERPENSPHNNSPDFVFFFETSNSLFFEEARAEAGVFRFKTLHHGVSIFRVLSAGAVGFARAKAEKEEEEQEEKESSSSSPLRSGPTARKRWPIDFVFFFLPRRFAALPEPLFRPPFQCMLTPRPLLFAL